MVLGLYYTINIVRNPKIVSVSDLQQSIRFGQDMEHMLSAGMSCRVRHC